MLMLHSPCSFFPFDCERNRVGAVRAFDFDGVLVPPRIFPAKLHDGKVREDVVVKEAAESARIVAVEFELLP